MKITGGRSIIEVLLEQGIDTISAIREAPFYIFITPCMTVRTHSPYSDGG